MSLLLLCVCLFVVICSVSNVGILCVFFSSLVGSFGCGTTWIWCWNLLPFDQRFFISRQLVTFYLHFFANFARRFGSHMVHFSHLCQIWRSSAPRFCFPCGDFEMRMSISIYTIVITFTDLNRVITMITWHLKKEFFLFFVLPQIKWIFHAALVDGAASVWFAIWRISVDPDIASITLRTVISDT